MASKQEPPGIDRVSAQDFHAPEFIKQYGDQLRPVVLLDIVPCWPAWQSWRTHDGLPNYEHLASLFGDATVPVVDCGPACPETSGNAKTVGYGDAVVQKWQARDFFAWVAGRNCDKVEVDAVTERIDSRVLRAPGSAEFDMEKANNRLLYLKDWHFLQECMARKLPVPYEAPDYLSSPLHDWLNLFLDIHRGGQDDYRFCYIGVKGTSTPLHHDVLLSHSWSANICGRKHWVLFPPDVASYLVDRRGDAISSASPQHRPEGWQERFPRLDEAWAVRHEVVQEAGELIFVPSGWYHQVENITDAVSINHNWLNASNAMHAWHFLQKENLAVHNAIKDLRDTFDTVAEYEEHCQVLMRANCGLDFSGWLCLLKVVAAEILRHMNEASDTHCKDMSDTWSTQWAASRLRAVAAATLEDEHISASVVPSIVSASSELVDAMSLLREDVATEQLVL